MAGPDSWLLDRMVMAVKNVRHRLLRAVAALKAGGVPYAVAGGNAVAAWVARVDPSAVRNTPDVDILIRRADFTAAKAALESTGFVYGQVGGMDVFLDGPDARPRDAVHVIFANEKVRPQEPISNPDVAEFEQGELFCLLSLDALVRIKLTAFRDKDRMHIRDLIEVGLVNADWLAKLPPVLAERLRLLLENPED